MPATLEAQELMGRLWTHQEPEMSGQMARRVTRRPEGHFRLRLLLPREGDFRP